MDVNKICIGCMRELPQAGIVCPYCHYQNAKEETKEPYHHLKPYSILAGKYLVGKVLGEGGFGITYIGLDLNLEMKVAIKELYPNGYVTREGTVTSMVTEYAGANMQVVQKWKEGFIREARTLAKCSNLSGIVGVKDFFQENNTAYIIMEYLEGETLKEHLKKMGGKLPVQEVLSLMRPVISSLASMHEQGLIHRDISPDNIMMLPGGNVKLLDLGAARDYAGDGEKSLSVMLKPGYAPEEQYRTKGKQGPWTDVYALCATIYKCITGVTPPESMERMREDDLQKPSSMNIVIDPRTEEILLKGMEVYAEKRIQNMRELYQMLYDNNAVNFPRSVAEKPERKEVMPAATQTTESNGNNLAGAVKKIPQKYYYVAGVVVLLVIVVIAVIGGKGSKKKESVETEAVSVAEETTEAGTEAGTEAETEVVEEEPEEDYYAMAQDAFLNENYDKVLIYCGKALEVDLQQEDVYLLAAKAYLAQNDAVKAVEILEQGIDWCDEKDQLITKMEDIRESVQPVSCEVYNSLGELLGIFGYEDGLQLEYTSYNQGMESSHEYFSYDYDGNMVALEHYENGQLMFSEYYSYNGIGAKTSTTRYNSKSGVDWMEEYDNDSQGRVTAVYHYSSGKNLAWWDEYVYGANGHFQKLAHPNSGSTVVYNCLYEYDENGNETKYVEEDANGNITYMWEKEYDVFNNITLYSFGDSQQNYIYTYE